MVRSLLRYEQVRRRGDQPDVQADDSPFSEGRYFEASCLSSANVNDCVKVTGTNGGGRPKVRLCDPNDPALMPMTGIIAEKYSPQVCVVQVTGRIDSLTGLVAGEPYFVGPTGQPVTPEPSTLRRQLVGVALRPTQLLLYPTQAQSTQSVSDVFGEQPVGDVDGTNRVFSTSQPFVSGTLRVHLNGIRQKMGPLNDFTILSSTSFEFTHAPHVGGELLVDYRS